MKTRRRGILLGGIASSALLIGCSASPLRALGQPASNTLPSGGQVIAGQVTIGQSNASTLTVTEISNRAVVNWQSFNVGANARVDFLQPSSGSTILNRITGNGASEIFGQLTANGIVYLINGEGIIFAPGSQVNVGGLVASTLDIANANFMSGRDRFAAARNAAAISVRGSIFANQRVVLKGGAVNISGLVQAGSATANADGSITLGGTSVAQNGTLRAPGGTIAIDADTVALGAGTTSVANPNGPGGTISVIGQTELTASSGQIIDASGTTRGGTIALTAQHVDLTDTQVIARGGDAGGIIRVGGDPHGQGSLADADITSVDQTTVLDASATTKGDGGQITVWGTTGAAVHGTLLAHAGKNGGNGGEIETSGHFLDVDGVTISTAAGAGGTTGTWLLDPVNITISTANSANVTQNGDIFEATSSGTANSTLKAATLLAALANSDVVIDTNAGPGASATGAGNITVNTALTWSSAHDLTFNAAKNITINTSDAITYTGATTQSLTMNAGSTITANATIGATGSGGLSVVMNARTITIAQPINSLAGSILLNASAQTAAGGGKINLNSTLTSTGSGAITLISDSDIAIANAIQAAGVLTLDAGRTITMKGALSGASIVATAGDTTVQTLDTLTGAPSLVLSAATTLTASTGSVSLDVVGGAFAINKALTVSSPLASSISASSLALTALVSNTGSGDLLLSAPAVTFAAGAGFATTLGNITAYADDGGSLSITTAPTISGNGTITLTADNTLTSAATLTVTGNASLALEAQTINVTQRITTANGSISITASQPASGSGGVLTDSNSLTAAGSGGITLIADTDIAMTGTVTSANALLIDAGRNVTLSGAMTGTGLTVLAGDLSVQTPDTQAGAPTLGFAGTTTLKATSGSIQLDAIGGAVAITKALTINGAQASTINGDESLTIGAVVTNAGSGDLLLSAPLLGFATGSGLTASVGNITAYGDHGGSLSLTNTLAIAGSGTVTLMADGDLSDAGIINGSGTATIALAGQTVEVSQRIATANASIVITAGSPTGTGGGILTDTATLTAGGTGGITLISDTDIQATATLTAAQELLIDAGRNVTLSGTMTGSGVAILAGDTAVQNADTQAGAATLGLAGTTTLKATSGGVSLNAIGGTVSIAKGLSINANSQSTVTGSSLLIGATVTNAGSGALILSSPSINFATGASLSAIVGDITAYANQGSSLNITSALTIAGNGTVSFRADNDLADSGAITATGNASIAIEAQTIELTARIKTTNGSLTVTAGQPGSTTGGFLTDTGILSTSGTGDLVLISDTDIKATTTLSAAGNLSIEAGRNVTLSGSISGTGVSILAGDAAVQTADTQTGSPTISLAAATSLTASTGSVALSASGGLISIGKSLSLSGNLGSTIDAGSISVSALVTNAGPGLLSLTAPVITFGTGANLAAVGGNITADADHGGSLALTRALTISGSGTVTLLADTGVTDTATITASGGTNLAITAPSVTIGGGIITDGGSISITARSAATGSGGMLTDTGALTAGGSGGITLIADTDAAITASLTAGGVISIEAGRSVVLSGVMSGGSIAVTAGDPDVQTADTQGGIPNLSIAGVTSLTATTGSVALSAAGGAVSIGNQLTLSGVTASTISATNIAVNAATSLTASGGAVALTSSGGGIAINGALILSGTTGSTVSGDSVAVNATVANAGTGLLGITSPVLTFGSGAVLTATVGDIIAYASGGSISLANALAIGGTGTVTLQADNTIDDEAQITGSGLANISLIAETVTIGAGITTGGGSIAITASTTTAGSGGMLTDLGTLRAGGTGGIRLSADTDATIAASLIAGGVVSIEAGRSVLVSGTMRGSSVAVTAGAPDVQTVDTQAGAPELSIAGSTILTAASGSVALSAIGGTVSIDNQLTLSGVTAASITGTTIAVNAATLLTALAGSVTLDAASGGVTINNALTLSGASASSVSGNTVAINSTVTNAGVGLLTLSSPGLTFGSGAALMANAGDITAFANGGSISLTNTLAIGGGGTVTLLADNSIDDEAAIIASGATNLSMTAGTITIGAGITTGGGSIAITATASPAGAGGVLIDTGALKAGGSGGITLIAGTDADLSASLTAGGALAIESGGTIELAGVMRGSSIAITGGDPDAQTAYVPGGLPSLSIAGATTLTATTGSVALASIGGAVSIDNALTLSSSVGSTVSGASIGVNALVTNTGAGLLTLNSPDLTFGSGAALMASVGDITAYAAGGSINLASSLAIGGTGTVTLSADNSINDQGTITASGGTAVSLTAQTVTIAGDVTTDGGAITVTASGGALVDSGDLLVNGTGRISLTANTDMSLSGNLTAGGRIELVAGGSVTLPAAISGSGISVTAGDTIGVSRPTTLTATTGSVRLTATSGTILISDPLTIQAVTAATLAAGAITIDATLTNAGAALMTLTSPNLNFGVGAGLTAGVGNITANADGGLLDIADALAIGGSGLVTLQTNGVLTTEGQITGTGGANILISAQTATLNAGISTDGGSITVTASSAANNGGGVLTDNGILTTGGQGAISLFADTDIVMTASLSAGGKVTAEAARNVVLPASISGSSIVVAAGDAAFQTSDSLAGTPSLTSPGSVSLTASSGAVQLFSVGGSVTISNPWTISGTSASKLVASRIDVSALVTNAGAGAFTLTAPSMMLDAGAALTAAAGGIIVDASSGGSLSIANQLSISGAGYTLLAADGNIVTTAGINDNGSGALALVAGNDLTLGADISPSVGVGTSSLKFEAGGNISIQARSVRASGAIVLWSGDANLVSANTSTTTPILTIGAQSFITSTSGSITAVADSGAGSGGMFVNNNPQMPFSSATNWQIFSTDPSPAADILGGIPVASASKRYNCVYGNGSPACNTAGEVIPTGNVLFYSFAPVILVTPGDTKSIYGDETSVDGVKYVKLDGFIDGDTAASIGLSGNASFATVATNSSDVGHYDITYQTGLLSSLGYQFADNTGSAGEYAITPRSVSLSTVSIASKTYDGSTSARILGYGALINAIPGDDVGGAGGVATFDSPTVENNKLVMVYGVYLTGAKAMDYVLTSTSITGYGNINVLSNNFIGTTTSGTTSSSSSAASTSGSASASSNAPAAKVGSGDLAVENGDTNGNVDTISATSDATLVTVSLPIGSTQAEPAADEPSTPHKHLIVPAASGFLVKADDAARGGVLETKSEINALVSRRGLGVAINRDTSRKP